MNVFLTDKGLMFKSELRVVEKHGAFELEPKIIAEPGDLMFIEFKEAELNLDGNLDGNSTGSSDSDLLLMNLTRAAWNNPNVVHRVEEAVFVEAAAS